MGSITETRLERRALQHDTTTVGVRETLDTCVLLAETHAAREQDDGRGEIETQKTIAQRSGGTGHAEIIESGRYHARMFHIVLFEPEIPPNTGNVIRLCANTGAELHLIRPLGFDLDRRSVRRAGLDYRWMAAVHIHEDFAACRVALAAQGAERWFAIETGGSIRYDEIAWQPGDVMIFGSERHGLPMKILEELKAEVTGDAIVSIPMREGNRSLNLSNAVALVLYEAWRQTGFAISTNRTPL